MYKKMFELKHIETKQAQHWKYCELLLESGSRNNHKTIHSINKKNYSTY